MYIYFSSVRFTSLSLNNNDHDAEELETNKQQPGQGVQTELEALHSETETQTRQRLTTHQLGSDQDRFTTADMALATRNKWLPCVTRLHLHSIYNNWDCQDAMVQTLVYATEQKVRQKRNSKSFMFFHSFIST